MAVIAYRSKARSLTVAWGAGRPGPRPSPVAKHAATVADVTTTHAERGAKGGTATAEKLTDEQRQDRARKAAAAAHAPATLAGRIVKAWPELDDAGRAEVLAVLRDGGVIQP